MISLNDLNVRLAPLGRRLLRARARDGVMRYALAPEFDLVWSTYGEAIDDLSQLRAVSDFRYYRRQITVRTFAVEV